MDYIVGEVLYTGSDTRVVVATHRGSGTHVVLKLPRADVPHPKTLDKLREEYALLRAVELPGVVRAIALEGSEQRPMLVLERWGDVSLDRALEDGPLAVDVALRLGARIARALGHVHRQGILHRDVKPQNILVNAERTDVRLIDFGVATRRSLYVDADAAVETLAGTLAYIAPEQTGRMNRVADARADLYALGATLYQMLTGMLPFETNDALELIHAHIARTPVPPHLRAAGREIPEGVSAIVLKLMEKNPDRRYRTAFGAAFDLECAARQWEESGTVASWTLATRDWEDRVRKPSRLHGRETELSALRQAWANTCDGVVRLELVAGPSGVGKSALVQELRDAVRARNGAFAPGKFDLLQRGIPYSALAQALRSVVHRRLGDPADALARWKQAWHEAAGPNARILVDLMPELVHILGEPAPLAELGPIEARNRFQTTVQRFARTIATAEHPLCLFIDDVQWADPASLLLLQELLTDPDAEHLLVLFAYRDDEVDQAHPLPALLQTLEGKGVAVHTRTLAPLGDEALSSMVADILDQPVDQVELLSRLVKDKTDGSPFFVGQFLQTLHEQKLLSRDLETGQWQFEREAIEKSAITDNVATLLTHRLTQMPDHAGSLLRTGACIGSRFDLAMLSHVEGKPLDELRLTLEEAVREGFLVREGDPTHFSYAFVHDRVQQAAGALIDAELRQDLHLRIGRRLRDAPAGDSAAEVLFDTVQHLNAGSARIGDLEERAALVHLNLEAGRTAKASTAYAAAASFFNAGISLLDAASWENAHDLTFRLHCERAECDTLAGQFEKASAELEELLARAQSDPEHAEVLGLRIGLSLSQSAPMEGLAAGRAALRMFGVELPDTPQACGEAFGKEVLAIEQILAVRPLESLIDAPLVTDPGYEGLLKLLGGTALMSFMANPALAPVVMAKQVHFSLSRGQAKASIGGYAFYSFIIASMEQYPLAIRLTRLAAELTKKHQSTDVECNVYMQLGTFCAFCEPMRLSLPYLARSQRVGLETGDHFFASLAFFYFPLTQFRLGEPLDAVGVEVDRSVAAIRRTKDVQCTAWIAVLRQIVDRLQGRHDGRALWNGEPLEEAEWAARVEAHFVAVPCSYHLYKLQFFLFQEEYDSAIAEASAVEERMGHLLNLHWTTDLPFYASLALSALYPGATPDEQARYQETLDRHGRRLAKLAELCPQNELHRQRLVDAERARISGKDHEAIGLYDEAIALARRDGFPHHEALANELCAKFHLAKGRAHVARIYMIEALHGYKRWGAHTVARRIPMRYPELFTAEWEVPGKPVGLATVHPAERTATRSTTITSGTTTTTGDGVLDARLDVVSVLRAAHALSGDMVLPSLVGRMLRILAENAGAERAVLALSHEGGLRIEAMLTLNPERLQVGLDEPVAGSQRLPSTLVQFVARNREALVLGRAMSDSRFDDDPYLRANRPASVLAVPLLHQGRLSGVMYLEHPQADDAFAPARVSMIALLASQAATAVENATLYAEVQRKTEALLSSNERLEREVEERTAELRVAKEAADTASQAKSDFLTSMSHELRTPLNSILGYAQLLEHALELSAENRDRVRIIKKSGEHLLTLIQDLLDLAKIEAGRLELVPSDMHFPSFIETVVGLCRVRAEQKGLTFSQSSQGPALRVVRADEKRLTQVLVNLLGNAIKFTPQGGVSLHVEVLGEVHGGKREVRLQIGDTGPGIAPQQLARIFDPFEQSGDPAARAEGTGLGLAITKRIVDRMGGSLAVQSEIGRGSVFTVTLGLIEVAESTVPDAATWPTIVGYEGARRLVLVVDDSAENRGVIRGMLTPLGFSVLECESGEQALRTAEERRPHVVVMDIVLPNMDGYQTTWRLRQLPELADMVILASSARVSSEQHRQSTRAGCNDFLPKPIEASVLLEQLERHLGLRWVRKTIDTAPAASQSSNAPPCRPSIERLAELLDLANRGRMQDFVAQAKQLEQEDARLQPWVHQACMLADGFQLKNLRHWLQSDLDAARA